MRTIHITIPYHIGQGRVEALFEQLLDNVHNSISNEKISFELVAVSQHIHFYMTFTDSLYEFIVGQVYALYPDAEILETRDYITPQAISGKAFHGIELGTVRNSNLYPTQVYEDFEKDPLSGVYSILSKTHVNEMLWVQVVVEKNNDNLWFQIKNKISRKLYWVKRFFAFRDRMKRGSSKEAHSMEKAWFDRKIQGNVFQCTTRIMSWGTDPQVVKDKAVAVARGYFQINDTELNGYKIQKSTNNKSMLSDYKKRTSSNGFSLNAKELTTIYHIPNPDVIPNTVYVMSRKNEPPLDLPKAVTGGDPNISAFGTTNYHNTNIPFGIQRIDRRRHLYTVGKSGSGKSKMLELLINEDIRQGHGVAVLDPHGDLVDDIMRVIPEHRKEDVIYFDPGDTEFPIAFNLMENVGEKYKMQVTIGFIQVFKKLFGDNWSDRLEHVLRYTTLALLDSPNTTVFSILKMLTDKNYRQMIVRNIQDDVVKNFWVNEFAGWSEKFDSEAITPLLNKVGQFVSTNMIRNIVGQPKNTFDLRKVMDNKKILLVKVSKGLLGEENAQLIGAMIVTKLYQAAMSRADMPQEDRQDFYFYVDEFQNFATDTFAEILSEARKYRLNMTLAHQYMGQLSDTVRTTVFGNVGSMISFRVGAEDAAIMAQEFTPFFSVRDIINLGVQEFYVKMSVNGQVRDPFSGKTVFLQYPAENYVDEIKRISREKYCQPLKIVEDQLRKWEEGAMEAEKVHNDVMPEFEAPII